MFMKISNLGIFKAGLRTGNFHSPFLEEAKRTLVGNLADYHFIPTEFTTKNLRTDGNKTIYIIDCSGSDC